MAFGSGHAGARVRPDRTFSRSLGNGITAWIAKGLQDGTGALEAAGVRVLLDDRRGVSPGVKFNDAELVGVPTIVVVGRGLADGLVEVKDRRTGERHDAPLTDVVAQLVAAQR